MFPTALLKMIFLYVSSQEGWFSFIWRYHTCCHWCPLEHAKAAAFKVSARGVTAPDKQRVCLLESDQHIAPNHSIWLTNRGNALKQKVYPPHPFRPLKNISWSLLGDRFNEIQNILFLLYRQTVNLPPKKMFIKHPTKRTSKKPPNQLFLQIKKNCLLIPLIHRSAWEQCQGEFPLMSSFTGTDGSVDHLVVFSSLVWY